MPSYPPVRPEAESANFLGVNFTQTIHNDTYPAIAPTLSNFKGKAVYITGASKGIGLALALSYAAAGASKIGLGARSLSATIQDDVINAATKAGHPAPQILKHSLDVTDAASITEAAKSAEKEFGQLDILINNAGYLEKWVPLCEADETEYWRTWEINYRGVYLVSKAFIPLLLQGGDKTIINLSSIGALGISRGASSYQTTKYAVLRFTEFLNADYGEQGLLAFSVHPGGIQTEMVKNAPDNISPDLLVDSVELAADAMVFLTNEKREWLAGRYISCTWDMPEFISREKEIVEGDKLKMRMVW
ncbi:short chain dehydrogenase reductase family protein [Rutstroemia sp. NJR-2017a WRK4]|nr:short chain dehydrogenase reductase family protein [Rutstroemia sp. NJR-2017a WRK4]